MKNLSPLETAEQKTLVEWLKIKKLNYFAIPNGAVLKGKTFQRARQMQKLKAEGLIAGTSDIVVFTPTKMLFIEMKRIKGSSVSQEQKDFIEMVNQYPYAVGKVCKGAAAAIEFIEKYLNVQGLHKDQSTIKFGE